MVTPWRLTASDHVNYEESESSMTRQSENDLATRYNACDANLSGGLGIIARNESWYMQSENQIRVLRASHNACIALGTDIR